MTYNYIVVDQDLRTVLQQFGANLGLRVSLSEAVQGRVRGRLPSAPPRQFLDHLAQVYGFDWYFDGSMMAISASSEAETRFVPLQGITVPMLEAGLRSVDLYDPRFNLHPGPGTDMAMVSGPPRYVKLVQDTAASLAIHTIVTVPATPPTLATLTVFRGVSTARVTLP